MAKHKNLKCQMHYIIKQHERLGISKRAERLNGVDTQKYIYSLRTSQKMHRFATTFGNFMKNHYPLIKRFNLVQSEHFLEYFRERGAQWSVRTCGEYESQARKLVCMINDTYTDCNIDLSELRFDKKTLKEDNSQASGRNQAMSIEDYNLLQQYMLKTKSRARFIPSISYSIGARLEEACSIKPENIILESDSSSRVQLRNCKNGRNRDVPIRPKDLLFWENLKAYIISQDWINCAGGINISSASKSIRRAMDYLGLSQKYPDTSIHAIRKLYARERFEEERSNGKIQKEAWSVVQKELGHGSKNRPVLFNTYIGYDL